MTDPLIPAILFVILALLVIAVVFKLVFSGLFLTGRNYLETRALQVKQKALGDIEENLDNLKIPRALAEHSLKLRQCFLLNQIKSSIGLSDKVLNHNLTVLSRIITISERRSTHLTNLAVVEDLFMTRSELSRSYLETVASRNSVERKQTEKGRDTPSWVNSEYDKKLAEVLENLAVNQRSLESQLDSLFRELARATETENVTYH